VRAFLDDHVRRATVLDPACGSGNFLYVALELLHGLEKQALLHLARIDQNEQMDIRVGPQQVFGIELNPYAHELAQVTVWIGHLQWMVQNGFAFERNPVLKKLDNIQCRDALIDWSNPLQPQRAIWPSVDFIVGNPPFLGDKKMLQELGKAYVTTLRKIYEENIPGSANFVCFWFEQARSYLPQSLDLRIGFVATNSMKNKNNRIVLEGIKNIVPIFKVWSDEPWIVDGADVRISIICFGRTDNELYYLDNQVVSEIFSDLRGRLVTSNKKDLTTAFILNENLETAFTGAQKNGKYNIPGELARSWIALPLNPNGMPNTAVLKKWTNVDILTKSRGDFWIVDFGVAMKEEAACLYEAPYQYLKTLFNPTGNNKNRWWLLPRPRGEMRIAISKLKRFILTPRHSKHRLFVWCDHSYLPDSALVVIAKDDDTFLGILHSKLHEVWTLAKCPYIGVGNDPRYSHTETFETFPFPEGLTPNIPASQYAADPRAVAIAQAAQTLDELRNNWLNPPDLVVRVPEVVPGYPDRLLPKDAMAEAVLKKRTLTNLYNQRPQWLINAHRTLDESVCAAYGWDVSVLDNDDEILARLFALNQERAAQQRP
jgi:type II restriction/modification system DNA methylase subunit YeeA